MERTISPISLAIVTLISPLCLGAIYAANALPPCSIARAMLCARASTSGAGYWSLARTDLAEAGAGVASLVGSGGAAGAVKRMGSAGAAVVSISLARRPSASRRLGGDCFPFEAGAEIRAMGAAAALGAGGSLRRSGVFARDLLRWVAGPSPGGGRLAPLAADLAAAALAGLNLPRALGWLGVLAITSVSCRVRAGGLVPFWS